MKDILGIPIIENALLPKGTAFLVTQDKGVVTQMVEVYNEMKGLSTADLISELEKRNKCGPACVHYRDDECFCIWDHRIDNFKQSSK